MVEVGNNREGTGEGGIYPLSTDVEVNCRRRE